MLVMSYFKFFSIFLILYNSFSYPYQEHTNYNITVIGAGYAGLVTSAILSNLGFKTTCIDIDVDKITQLQNGILPIYEIGLRESIFNNTNSGLLSFTSSFSNIATAHIIFIVVGTPIDEQGCPDLTQLYEALKNIITHHNGYKIICIRSTIPVGTHKKIEEFLQKHGCAMGIDFDLVVNPEFTREGSALEDAMHVNPIVLGSNSSHALNIFKQVYQPLIERGLKMIETDLVTAESIKSFWNAYSMIRISYINELSLLCAKVGADVFKVIEGISASEELLPTKQIKPGPGIGGSCLPKDTQTLLFCAKQNDIELGICEQAISSNNQYRQKMIDKIFELLPKNKNPFDKKIAMLGVSFKANTDDIRGSIAISALEKLLKLGVQVNIYDPHAMEHIKPLFPAVNYCNSVAEAVEQCDLAVFFTDWDEFKTVDLGMLKKKMKKPVIFDARNIFSPQTLKLHGFTYENLGRRS